MRLRKARPFCAITLLRNEELARCTFHHDRIKLKRDAFRERGGASLSPQSLAHCAGDKLSPRRLSELDAAQAEVQGCIKFANRR